MPTPISRYMFAVIIINLLIEIINDFQAAYVARLQQQAAQIKQLLKLLNNTGVTNSTNFSNNTENATNESSKETSSFVPSEINNETGGYEALWELSERTLTNVGEDDETTTEVEEDEDVSGDHEDLYENTGAFSNNFSLSVGKICIAIKYFLVKSWLNSLIVLF